MALRLPHGGVGELWMHNGFLQVEGEKMSKSLGNFVTIYDLCRRIGRARSFVFK